MKASIFTSCLQKSSNVLANLATLALWLCFFWVIDTGPAAAEEMRVLNFPPGETYGQINVMEKGWEPAKVGKGFSNESYAARGQVRVARSKTLSLTGSFALGEHPDVLKKIPADAFARLDLGKLDVGSRDMANISHLTGLLRLELDQTNIDDSGIQYLKPLINLRYLSISRTLLKGKTLGELAALKKLERLHLGHCDLDPANLASISKLTTVRFLHLASDKVSDATIDFLMPLTMLWDLGLDGNSGITDKGVKKLACFKSLHNLNLADSKVSEAGILALRGLPLVTIKLGNTRVTLASQTKLKKAFPKCAIECAKSHETPIEVFEPLH